MRGRWRMLLLILCACKAEIGGGSPGNPDAPNSDVLADDAPTPDAMLGPWSAPMLVPGASTSGIGEDDGTLSHSLLELVFSRAEAGVDSGRKHLYWMSRPSVTSMTWSAPVRLSINLDGTADETPRFSADDKTLFFASSRIGTTGGLDIWQTTRPTVGVATGWSTPTLLGTINSAQTDKWCMPCSLGRYVMVSGRNNPANPSDDIYEGLDGAAPTLVTQLSDLNDGDTAPFIASDCLTIYFASSRSGTNRIYTSTRASVASPWAPPVALPDFQAVGLAQEDPWLSQDQRTFVFSATTTAGNKDVYITTR